MSRSWIQRSTRILLVAGCVLLAVSCSGSSDPADEGAAASSTTEAATTAAPDGTTYCAVFDEYKVEITGVGVDVTPEAQEEAFTKVAPALDQLDQLAPDEIRADTEVLTDHLRAYSDLLETYDWSYERISAEASAEEQAALDPDEAAVAAFRAVTAYVTANCSGVVIPGSDIPAVSVPE